MAVHVWEGQEVKTPGVGGSSACRRDFTPPGLPSLNPPPWYLLVSEIKLLLPLGHPSVGDPLLSPSLCHAETRHGGRMVPAAAGGQERRRRGHWQLPGARCPASPVLPGWWMGSHIGVAGGITCPSWLPNLVGTEAPTCAPAAPPESPRMPAPSRPRSTGSCQGTGGSGVRAAPPTQGRSERGWGGPRRPGSPSWLWP